MAASTQLTARIAADTSDFRRGMNEATGSLRKLQGVASGFRNIAIGAALATGLKESLGYIGEAVKLSSDLSETMSKVGQVFGKSTEDILAWSKSTPAAFISTQKEILDAVAGSKLLLSNLGFGDKESNELAKRLTERGADLASFYNTSAADANAAISSALRGEFDPIERLGVVINDTTLKQKAMTMGLYKGTGALTSQAKAAAVSALIMEKSAQAQNDITRTQGGYANQVRALNVNYLKLKQSVGDVFKPLAERWLPLVNRWMARLVDDGAVRQWQTRLLGVGKTFEGWVSRLGGVDGMLRRVSEWYGTLQRLWSDLSPAVMAVADGVKAAWSAFQSLSPETKANLALIIAAGAAFKAATSNPIVKIGVGLTSEFTKGIASGIGEKVGTTLFDKVFDRPQPVRVVNKGWDLSTDTDGKPKGKPKILAVGLLAQLAALGLTAAAIPLLGKIPPDWSWNSKSIGERISTGLNYALIAETIPMPAAVKVALVPIVALVGFLKDNWEQQQVQIKTMLKRMEGNGGSPYGTPYSGSSGYPAVGTYANLGSSGYGSLVRAPERAKPQPINVDVLIDGRAVAKHVRAQQPRRVTNPRLSLIGA